MYDYSYILVACWFWLQKPILLHDTDLLKG